MAYSGVLEDIRKCVRLEQPSRIPVFALSQEFDVRMSGMIYEEYCQDANKIFKCQKEVIEKFDYDWAWVQIDDCIVFEVLGVGTKGSGNILRATVDYLPPTWETLKNLKMPDPYKDGRMPVLLEAISKLKSYFGDKVCVCGRTEAPFSSVTLLYGIEETMMLIYSNEKLLRETMEFFVELQSMFGKAQLEAGADALWYGDCNASSHLISPKVYKEFAFEPAKKVVEEYKKAGGLTFYHASEEGESLPIMVELGADALSVGPGIDIKKALEVAKGKVCIVGNIDPIKVLERGSVEEVRRETIRIIEEGKKYKGFIFNSGEEIPRDTPEENIKTMVETAKKWGVFS